MGLLDKLKGFTPSGIASDTIGAVIGKVMDGADALFTSKEEKLAFEQKLVEEANRHEEAKEAKDLEEIKSYLADTQNARDNNAKIQESEKASWTAKNFAYIMDGFFVLIFGAMLFVIIKKEVPEANKELFYTAFGLLGGFVGTTVNFHRGTSQGSKDSNKTLHNLVNKA